MTPIEPHGISIPNALTWGRIVAIPLIIVLFYLPYHWADPAAGLLFAAGRHHRLARRLPRAQAGTRRRALGAFLDPVADKLLVAAALVLIVQCGQSSRRAMAIVTPLAAIVIIGREIAISALREWMAEIGQRGKVAVSGSASSRPSCRSSALSMMLFRWNFLGLPIYDMWACSHGAGRSPDTVVSDASICAPHGRNLLQA